MDYVGKGDTSQFLDIYIPSDLTKPARTVVYIHGGGWYSGNKGTAMALSKSLFCDYNYVIVDINYRLSTDSIFPAQIYDCKTAIRFLKMNADRYQIDTCNIGVMGESAGGHLSALLGTTIDIPSLAGMHLGHHQATSKIHAVIDLFGATDFFEMVGFFPEDCPYPYDPNSSGSFESQLLGCRINNCPERAIEANPISYIDGNEPPFSIHHGDSDCLVATRQSELLHEALLNFKQTSNLTIYEGYGHGGFAIKARDSIVNFFNRHLVNECGIVSTTEDVYKPNLEITPNPFRDFIEINGGEKGSIIKIIDRNGVVVGNDIIKFKTYTLNNLNLIPGIYFIVYRNAKGKLYVRRIVKT